MAMSEMTIFEPVVETIELPSDVFHADDSETDFVGDVIAHYGIKGMRWGTRRSDAELAKARGVADRLADARAQDKTALVKTKRGYSTGEAVAAAELKSIAKQYGTSALTNADLKQLNERLNLEANYAKLSPKEKSKVQKALDGVQKAYTINKKLGNPAGKAVKAILDNKTAGAASKATKATKSKKSKKSKARTTAPLKTRSTASRYTAPSSSTGKVIDVVPRVSN